MAFTKIAAAGIGTTETVTVDGLTVINNGSFGGNLSVGGTLTYEDVTNVDSVGLITARNGIVVGSGITLSKDGNIFATGISTFGGNIQLSGTNPEIELNSGGPRFRVPASNTLSIFTSGGLGSTSDERVRITSSGQLLVNHTSARTIAGGNSLIQVEATDSTGRISIVQNRTEAEGAPFLSLGKSRGGSVGSATIVQSGDTVGTIAFAGADGTDFPSVAQIVGQVDGTPGNNDMPGRLIFKTCPDGSDSTQERLRITSDGRIDIGGFEDSSSRLGVNASSTAELSNSSGLYNQTNPAFLQIKNSTDDISDPECGIVLQPRNSGNGAVAIYAKRTGSYTSDLIYRTRTGANASAERFRIDSAGRVLINTTNNSNGHISSSNLAVQGADLAIFKDSGGDNVGVSGHKLKFVTQSGSLGEIDVLSEGGGGPSGRGGAMLFYTKANNTSSAAERVRITSDGAFGVGLTPSYQFHVKSGSVDQTARFDNSKTGDNLINYIGVSLGNAATTGTALFGITGHSTTGSQACWIGMGGDDVAGGYGLKVFRGGNAVAMQRFAVGTQDHSGFVSGTDASTIISYSKTYRFALYIRPSDNDTGGGNPALFANQAGTAIGSISANASNVAFNTSSDYRLKENDISIIDGITRLKKLRPIKFNWKTDTEKTVDGFFAHEVSSSVPEAVMGEKDAVNEDGSIKPQQLDYSKLVPLLTAALQEEIAKRESLEARLDAAGL